MVNDLGERQESYFCRFTFGQFVTFATLEIAMLFFVFYLGARFGPEIAGLRSLPRSEEEASPDVENPRDVVEIQPKPLLDDLEPRQIKASGETAVAVPAEPQEPALRTLRSPSPESDSQLLKSSQNVVRVKQTERSRFTVQVGSYPTVKEGTTMVERWKGKGYEAYLTLGEIPGRGIWYRVRIGNFGSKEEAEKEARLINTKEKSSAIVVAQEN